MQRTKALKINTFGLLAAGLMGLSMNIACANEADAAITNADSGRVATSTIGRLAEKQKRLYELELDAKIKDAQDKIDGVSGSNAFGMPPVQAMPAYDSMSTPVESDPALIAVYGPTNNLQAEVQLDGRIYIVSRGSKSLPGWIVDSVSSNKVALSKGKKKIEVYISTGSSEPTQQVELPAMPPMPNGF